MARCLRETRWEMADRHRPGHSDREAVNGALQGQSNQGTMRPAIRHTWARYYRFRSAAIAANGAIGMSDIEGKAAREAVSELGNERVSIEQLRKHSREMHDLEVFDDSDV